ncbi:zinc finger and SCAN domain-containing protein 12-like [Xyrauchen texanus]|uniref:zinc finger and SCAN domain-containing protein 12-like n=1 Tax=Xyrauchen texanus TaxID=154827 RepID=UPI002241BF46|nr:zinc finger and SCAN domain-containing protein 12-like [Xyrauchen texanus]
MNRGRKAAPKTSPTEQPEEVFQELGKMEQYRNSQDSRVFSAGASLKVLQHQFGLLQLEVQARTTPTPNPLLMAGDPLEGPDDEEAVPSRLLSQSTTCQKDRSEIRAAAVCRWPKEDWAFRLIPLLTGKARAAYVHMDVDDSLDYEEVKSVILRKYDINQETYRQQFRSLDVEPLESPKELYVRLKELYGKWIQPKAKSVEEVGEIIILEQYLRMLSPELQVWLREHDPKTAAQAATLADVFVAARKRNQSWAWKTSRDDRRLNLPQQSQRSFSSAGKPAGGEPAFATSLKSHKRVPICYLCGQEGHTETNVS